jgi:hypothetical protein
VEDQDWDWDWDRAQYNFLKRVDHDPNPNPFLILCRGNWDWDWDWGLTKLTGDFQSKNSFLSGGVKSSEDSIDLTDLPRRTSETKLAPKWEDNQVNQPHAAGCWCTRTITHPTHHPDQHHRPA